MYRRLVLFTAVILAGLAGLCLLGLHSLRLHAEGLRGRRLAEFAAVAEQVRVDVKRKLEALIGTEQARPYTDYQYYYVPLAANQETALVRSPIGDQLDNGLAYGYFQIDPDGSIVSPYVAAGAFDSAAPELRRYLEEDLQGRLGPALHGHTTISAHTGPETGMPGRRGGAPADLALGSPAAPGTAAGEVEPRQQASSHGAYRIDTFGDDQQVQVVHQERQMVIQNFLNVATRGGAPAPPASHDQVPAARDEIMPRQAPADPAPAGAPGEPANTVPIRIEPFVPIAVPSPKDTIFGHDVYLVRHVHIEQEHLLQGFRLNQERLLDEVAESADRLLRPGMGREIAGDVSALEGKASHVAALDFGFGSLALGLVEINPRRLAHELAGLRYGYVGVMAVVALATVLALGALWRNARAQVVLARKKDDFIAAVSHELRTPLASIRMYTEMLEKGWVRTEAKRAEYYGHMCHETERLSRLIENVLDFSRIERGRE